MNYEEDSELLKAIAHPVRLKIVIGLINDNECNVNVMVKKLGIPQSTVSQHLGILRTRGIIKPRKDGLKTCYCVCDEKIKKIVEIMKG